MWAWLHFWSEELRRPQKVLPRETDKEEEDVVEYIEGSSTTYGPIMLPPDVHNRSFGTIPVIMSFRDHAQLATVGCKEFHLTEQGRGTPAELQGRITWQHVIHPPNTQEEESSLFMLTEIVRQEDEQMLAFFT